MQTDAAHNDGVYLEFGSSGFEAYARLREAAAKVHPEIRARYDGANLALMICLDWYDSPELKKLVSGMGRGRGKQ